jgi:D-alanyl-D-alanine carboxypeptidase
MVLTGGFALHRAFTAPSAGAATEKLLGAVYRNGDLPDEALVPITDGYRLVHPAAEAFGRLEAAALDAGFALQVNSAYRTYDEQVAMVEQYGLLSEGGTAAEPGTSEHGWGTAVDLTLDGEQLAWFEANAGRFGFRATVPGEPWHWAYAGER